MKKNFLIQCGLTVVLLGALYGCSTTVATPAGDGSATTTVESDATDLISGLDAKDRGLLAKCGGGLAQRSGAQILAGLRDKSLVGEFRKDSDVIAPVLEKDGRLNNTTYTEYVGCLEKLDPALIDKKK